MNTVQVSSREFPYKKNFIAHVKAGHNVTFIETTPSGRSVHTLREVQDRVGFIFTVTTFGRHWFAEVEIKAGRKVKVT